MKNKMENKKNEMLAALSVLQKALSDAKAKTEDFYSTMRWKELGLSEEEYDTLFELGKMYELEDYSVLDLLDRLENALNHIVGQPAQ